VGGGGGGGGGGVGVGGGGGGGLCSWGSFCFFGLCVVGLFLIAFWGGGGGGGWGGCVVLTLRFRPFHANIIPSFCQKFLPTSRRLAKPSIYAQKSKTGAHTASQEPELAKLTCERKGVAAGYSQIRAGKRVRQSLKPFHFIS